MTLPSLEQAKEIALKISDLIYCPDYGRHRETERHDKFITDVSTLVREYEKTIRAEDKIEMERRITELKLRGQTKGYAEGFRSALEEAAKIAESHQCYEEDARGAFGATIANRIRALLHPEAQK